jgi:heptaprenylglyceryl phosphate synthase
MLQNYDEAYKTLTHLVKIDPNNKDAVSEFEKVKKIRKEYLDKQTKAFSKMFG